ncbi:MAG: hypothetical protein M1832_000016 [Thelocarpon impressellum]|nr:MAG: hypothetical protein M1832_000016 [Thelocarpon impressellum]
MELHEALSGVFGSISLAAWVFVLIPQLLENYQQGSAEGISLAFLTVWFIGDITNFFGAVWAGLVPTVIALAVYFCFADLVLITQCVYYNVVNTRRRKRQQLSAEAARSDLEDPERPLLDRRSSENMGLPGSRRRSSASHLSRGSVGSELRHVVAHQESPAKVWARNASCVLGICAVGAAGWVLAWKTGLWTPTLEDGPDAPSTESPIGAQILGYMSAACYLGARIPQIVKNHKEQSCEGLSLLFFILSILGNATYGAGILFHSVQRHYVITNIPWLIGSLGTMVEDVIIFIQFSKYGCRPITAAAAR